MENRLPTLRELLGCTWHHLHLVQQGRDSDPATITRMHLEVLTTAGHIAWADVLGARVVRVQPGHFGVELVLDDSISNERLDRFTHMVAGINLPREYELWVSEEYQGAN